MVPDLHFSPLFPAAFLITTLGERLSRVGASALSPPVGALGGPAGWWTVEQGTPVATARCCKDARGQQRAWFWARCVGRVE